MAYWGVRKMMVEINDDYLDDLVAQSMIDSYVQISEYMESPNSWHEDDVASWEELLPAIMIVGKWYCFDFVGKLEDAKKKWSLINTAQTLNN